MLVTAVSRQEGLVQIEAKARVLAMGCRERPRGALNIPGTRPAGIFSAGTAQRLVNMEGYLPGKRVVILGSGDIGLIMARRMTLEGAKVLCVAELMPYSGGLKRNIVQCLNDFDIPLKLSHTVVDIQGKERVTGVTIAQVDEKSRPIPGTEEHYDCDTLLLSWGSSGKRAVPAGGGGDGPRHQRTQGQREPGDQHPRGVRLRQRAPRPRPGGLRLGRGGAGRPPRRPVHSGRPEGKRPGDPPAPRGAVRYTVPCTLSPQRMEETVVRFRVGRNIRKGLVRVLAGDRVLLTRKRPVMAPGEMEQVVLKREWFSGNEEEITVEAVEEKEGT